MNVPLLCVMISVACAAFADAAHPIVVCTGLNASLDHLMALEVANHDFPSALHEEHCVSIDPCTGLASTGHSVPQNSWTWANSSALHIARPPTPQHDNQFSLQFARVPEGVILRACQPNFDALRQDQVICNDDAVVTVNGNCPSLSPFTLLDCVASVEKTAVPIELPFRSQNQIMHFGSRTYNDACVAHAPSPGSPADALCKLVSSNYVVQLKRAAAVGLTQMVMWEFDEGWGCYDSPPVGFTLTGSEAPNKITACPPVENGDFVGANCQFECHPGYHQEGDRCVYGCDGSTVTACPDGLFAHHQCDSGGITFYNCTACPVVPGEGFPPWSSAAPASCLTTPCAAGSREVDGFCEPCPANAVSPAPGSVACTPCDTAGAGVFHASTGGSSCEACFAGAETGACQPGQQIMRDFNAIKAFFNRTESSQHEDMLAYCTAGYACLPCPPGSYERDSACHACAFASYQPNWRMTACYACAAGHNTSRAGAVDAYECQCRPGFDRDVI